MTFGVDKLAGLMKEKCVGVCFALLHGSAAEGVVRPGSDIDIALFVEGKASLEIYGEVADIVESLVPGVRCDVGILNSAEPVYRFEALKGKLLFTRDDETYLRFFSLTCREYESQMADYERQQKYRLQYG
ncbi:MAG: nucleotidyltransferase domain-containing protein [Planctomycetes bacterium]|nr:nucleotidyltransferase domain-containing protein [Planctomycetota bacterium]